MGALLFGPFRLDLAGKQLWRGEDPIALPPRALDLLIYLAEHSGQVLTREHLLDALWPDVYVEDHSLSVQIREIRKALADTIESPRYIQTRHRRGYCFRAHVERVAAPAGAPAASPAAETATPETRYARSGGVNIAYQVAGSGPIDLVFVMGWVSHLEYFWTEPRFARFLRRLGSFSRVILFDKRGTGLSDRVPVDQLPTIEQRMQDVHAVMDAAASERAVICGISEGGCMSAVFAATYPERTLALVMIGAYARRLWAPDYPWGPTVERRNEFLDEIRGQWGGPVGLAERAPSLVNDPEFREWWAAYLRMGASPGAAIALTEMNSEIDIRRVLPLVRVPALVIHRTGDRCLRVEEGRYLASGIPGATLVELPGDDHLPFVGDQDAILDPIARFLTQVQSSQEAAGVLATVLIAEFEAHGTFEEVLRAHSTRFRAAHAGISGTRWIAAFDGPARAVRCACAIRQEARERGIAGRIGLHTGESVSAAGAPLSGAAVTVAARVLESGAAGDVLVSGTLRDLVAGSGIEFQPHGRVEAPGLGEWQVLRVVGSRRSRQENDVSGLKRGNASAIS